MTTSTRHSQLFCSRGHQQQGAALHTTTTRSRSSSSSSYRDHRDACGYVLSRRQMATQPSSSSVSAASRGGTTMLSSLVVIIINDDEHSRQFRSRRALATTPLSRRILNIRQAASLIATIARRRHETLPLSTNQCALARHWRSLAPRCQRRHDATTTLSSSSTTSTPHGNSALAVISCRHRQQRQAAWLIAISRLQSLLSRQQQ